MHTKLQKLEQANQRLQLENDRLTAKVRELEAMLRRLENSSQPGPVADGTPKLHHGPHFGHTFTGSEVLGPMPVSVDGKLVSWIP